MNFVSTRKKEISILFLFLPSNLRKEMEEKTKFGDTELPPWKPCWQRRNGSARREPAGNKQTARKISSKPLALSKAPRPRFSILSSM